MSRTPEGSEPPPADLSRASLVIFDLDGTVVDTLGPTFRAFQDAVAPALGRVPAPAEILERFGPADHDIVAAWVGPEHAAAAVERLYRAYEVAFRDSGPFPGMVDLIRELRRRGKKTAIFTGRGRRSTDAILESMGLADLFDAVVCGDEVEKPKPDPEGLLRILELLGGHPENTVYVGDTLKDLESAVGAGIPFVGALWGSPEPEELADRRSVMALKPSGLRQLLLALQGESRPM